MMVCKNTRLSISKRDFCFKFIFLLLFVCLGCGEKSQIKESKTEGAKIQEKDVDSLLSEYFRGVDQWLEARKKLIASGPEGVEAMCLFFFKFFQNPNETWWPKARHEIANLGKLSVPHLIKALQKKGREYDTNFKGQIIETLSLIGEPALDDLFAEVNNKNEQELYRVSLIRAIGKIGSPRAVPILSDIYNNSKEGENSWMIRGYSLRALGDIGHVDGLSIIEKGLKDEDSFVREQAIQAKKLILGKTKKSRNKVMD